MSDKPVFDELLVKIDRLVSIGLTRDETLLKVCRLLKSGIAYYDWVGFYLVEGKKELVLGPFEGEPTEHARIAFGSGICGQAAQSKETFLIQDVSSETNYLSCSPKVKAEIVIPIFRGEKIVGELDIDSHQLSPFTDQDRDFLEEVCRRLSGVF
jgi:L-methionine (R)-S-oxide reductase